MAVSSADSPPDLNPSSSSTASDLLEAARSMDPDAWRELVNRYSWLVFQWCRNADLSAQDASDVVQSVMAQVAVYLRDFKKDGKQGSFRRWLRTITRTKIADFLRNDGKQPHGEGGSTAQRQLLALPEESPSSDVQDAASESRRKRIWEVVDRLEVEFSDSTWQAFWLTVVENLSAGDAAATLGLTPNAVRIAKWRVLQRLRAESGLAAEMCPPPTDTA
jgi:RNA polymerase sigma-70 factor (ECF subfamily)